MNDATREPNPPPFPRRICVVGLGLLGGSVAMAVRRHASQLSLHIVIHGYARGAATREDIVQRGLVDAAFGEMESAVAAAEMIVIATPVDTIADWVLRVAQCNRDATITDVGSTKATIVDKVAAASALASTRFVAAHPIAGGERSGAAHASANLFDGKPVAITPSGAQCPHHLTIAESFWRALGGRIVRCTPTEHDQHLASTSHVPHFLAALIARGVDPEAMNLVGSGWLDSTRIAAGDPDLWTAIVMENRPAILRALSRAASDLTDFETSIRGGDEDAVRLWLTQARDIRLAAQTRPDPEAASPE